MTAIIFPAEFDYLSELSSADALLLLSQLKETRLNHVNHNADEYIYKLLCELHTQITEHTRPAPKTPKAPKAPKSTNIIKKSFGAKRLDKPVDECSICMCVHTLRDGVHTACGHFFGRECYTQYQQKATPVNCPMCRSVDPCITVYNERKTKK